MSAAAVLGTIWAAIVGLFAQKPCPDCTAETWCEECAWRRMV